MTFSSSLIRLLLVLVCAFAALSSSTAAALDLAEERIVLFTALLVGLLLLPFLFRPVVVRPSGMVLVVCALLAWILLVDADGSFDALDAKIALPVLVLLAAPNLARHFAPEALMRFVWGLLATYVGATFAYQVLAEPAAVARGYEGIVRYDPTGSVVMHSSLSLICLALAVTRLCRRQALLPALLTLAVGAMALGMVLLTATRTALLTASLFLLLLVATSSRPAATLRGVLLALPVLGFVFAGYTLLVSDSFYLRLTGGQEDFTSGRASSIGYWLSLAAEHPFGLGLGAVRETLADGRPALDGTTLLEWPHDEPVRLYVEAGPAGLLFVVFLVGLLVLRAARAARAQMDPVRRAVILAIAADLVAEALLQNLLNAVYHVTVLVLILSLAIGTAPAPERAVQEGSDPAPPEQAGA